MILLLTASFLALIAGALAQTAGVTTRYWDCCKASCSWPGKASVSNPVTTCGKNDAPLSDYNTQSQCAGGSAFMCTSQSPWAVNDTLAYGFAAVALSGQSESQYCCSCYQLTFTSQIVGKTMVVQVTNTGGVGGNQFDIAIPGGGVGQFNACTQQWGAPANGWGAQYGGVSSRAACDGLPAALRPGCDFRFDWMQGADNPTMTFRQVTCPAEITAKSGCTRN